jgi:hypothetical protein
MHTQTFSLPVAKAVCLDDRALSNLGVIGVFLDSIEAGRASVDVTLDITDGSDDAAILRFLRSV